MARFEKNERNFFIDDLEVKVIGCVKDEDGSEFAIADILNGSYEGENTVAIKVIKAEDGEELFDIGAGGAKEALELFNEVPEELKGLVTVEKYE